MKFVIMLALLTASQLAQANVMNVAIDCKSASGRTVIAADLPGDDDDASISVSLDGKKSSILNEVAQSLVNTGNASLQDRIRSGDITIAHVATRESRTSYAVRAVSNGQTVFSLTSTGEMRLEVDREYGYRTGQFKAKMEAVHRGQPIKADLLCTYDYAP